MTQTSQTQDSQAQDSQTQDNPYRNRRVVVLGGATGMGAAAAQAAKRRGAHLTVLDVAEVPYDCDASITVDLRHQASVEAAVAGIASGVGTVLSCAGVADGTPGLPQINFISQRYFIDALVEQGKIEAGGAVVMISSVAGARWLKDIQHTGELVRTADWDAAEAFVAEHRGSQDYRFSKQAVNFYVAARALPFIQRGIRINAVCPGPTDTPLAQANKDHWLGFGSEYRKVAGVEALQPHEIANVMLFLGGPESTGVNGITMIVDHGHIGASVSDAYESKESERVKMIVGLDPTAKA